MPESSAPSNLQAYLTSAAALSCFGFALLCGVEFLRVRGTFDSTLGALSGSFLFRRLKERRTQSKARQHAIQTYLDRLLMAKTPEERQPILEEMSARQFLKGIFLGSSDLEALDLSFADFSRADLSGATLCGANLVGANFTGATLSYTDLSYTSLHGAILRGAHLRGVNLRGADLSQADLSKTMMRGANLVNASMNNAVLHNAQLHGTDLQNADLRHADLSGAVLVRAIMPDGSLWDACTDNDRFTDPAHSDFWQTNSLYLQKTSSKTNFPPPPHF